MTRTMTSFIRFIASVLLLSAFASALHAEIFECVDRDGTRRFTNIKADAGGCKPLNVGTYNTVPAPATPAAKAARPGSPAGFPRVDQKTQAQRDAERRRILEQELDREEKLLTQARQDLASQEAVRYGNERNYQRVLDRLAPYQRRVKLHEDNIADIKKELSAMR